MNYKEYTIKVYTNGYKFWYNKEGQLHREDGPAVEYIGGVKYWYLDGVNLTEAEFNAHKNKPSCAGTTVIIDGKKYKLEEE